MNDYLSTLVIRTMQPAGLLQPRMGGVFEGEGERGAGGVWGEGETQRGFQGMEEARGEEERGAAVRGDGRSDVEIGMRVTGDSVPVAAHGSGEMPASLEERRGTSGVAERTLFRETPSGAGAVAQGVGAEDVDRVSRDTDGIPAGPVASIAPPVQLHNPETIAPEAGLSRTASQGLPQHGSQGSSLRIPQGSSRQGESLMELKGESIAAPRVMEPKAPESSHLRHPAPILVPRVDVIPEGRPEQRTVHVTIGRIEVRAIMPREPLRPDPPAPASSPASRLSLDDYLRTQKRGYR